MADDDNDDTTLDPTTVFAQAKEHIPSQDWLRGGDKSQGWATQKKQKQQQQPRNLTRNGKCPRHHHNHNNKEPFHHHNNGVKKLLLLLRLLFGQYSSSPRSAEWLLLLWLFTIFPGGDCGS